MKKLTLLLIAELKRLGVRVVHATFNRVVICTNKKSVDDAKGFVAFLLDCLRKKELFTALDITPKRMWNLLSWLDPVSLVKKLVMLVVCAQYLTSFFVFHPQ